MSSSLRRSSASQGSGSMDMLLPTRQASPQDALGARQRQQPQPQPEQQDTPRSRSNKRSFAGSSSAAASDASGVINVDGEEFDDAWLAEQARFAESYKLRRRQEEEDAALARQLASEEQQPQQQQQQQPQDYMTGSVPPAPVYGDGDSSSATLLSNAGVDADEALALKLQAELDNEAAEIERRDREVALSLQREEEALVKKQQAYQQQQQQQQRARAVQLAQHSVGRGNGFWRRKARDSSDGDGDGSSESDDDGYSRRDAYESSEGQTPHAGQLENFAASFRAAASGSAASSASAASGAASVNPVTPFTESQLKIEFPVYWEPQQNERQMFDVKRGSEEYKCVAERFLEGLPGVQIRKIQRNQNRKLWTWYLLKKSEISRDNSGNANEKFVFHGSKVGAYEAILTTGFDHRVSLLSGAIGAGTYFAVSSLMSNGFVQAKGGDLRMLVVRVALGYVGKGKPGLRRPPNRRRTKAFPGAVAANLADSVSDGGGQNGSGARMFCIFDNVQAYPEYVVTYKR